MPKLHFGVLTCLGPSCEQVQYTNVTSSSAYGETVTIEVGSEGSQKTFYPYKGILSFYSGYFRAALSGSWSESKTGVIKLETEDADVFERFMLWLYTNRASDQTLGMNFSAIIKLWLFADRRNIPLLMNEMVDEMHRYIGDLWIVPTKHLHEIYEHTSEQSTLRRMVVNSMARTIGPALLEKKEDLDKWPKEALAEMLRLTLAEPRELPLGKMQYKALKMCPTYHLHEEGVSCKKQSFK